MGKILSQHGLGGWLKVEPFSGEVLAVCERWLVAPWELRFRLSRLSGDAAELGLRGVRPQARPPLFAFEGLEQREEAKEFNGGGLWLRREELPPCGGGEFFYADLERCSLVWQGACVARVKSVREVGPSVLLEVERGAHRYLVPFVAHFIGDVDVEKGLIELKHYWILE